MTVLDFQQKIKKNIIHAPGTKAGHHKTSPRLEKKIKLYVTKIQGLFELFVITPCLFKAAFNNKSSQRRFKIGLGVLKYHKCLVNYVVN